MDSGAKQRYEAYIVRWLAGEETGIRAIKTMCLSMHVRRWVMERGKYACEECGWNKLHPVDGRPLVEIDHRDGDASNNSPDNLRLLCPNCHSMTSTFRARNKNSKRNRRP